MGAIIKQVQERVKSNSYVYQNSRECLAKNSSPTLIPCNLPVHMLNSLFLNRALFLESAFL